MFQRALLLVEHKKDVRKCSFEKNSCSRIDKNWLTIDYANLTSMIQKGFLTPEAAVAHPILLSFNSSPQWNF
jgi:hypothetical protein